jgi:hypothetical protein
LRAKEREKEKFEPMGLSLFINSPSIFQKINYGIFMHGFNLNSRRI